MTPDQDPRLIYYGHVQPPPLPPHHLALSHQKLLTIPSSYIPSLELCIVALICYLTLTLTNLSSLLRFKTLSTLPLLLGCLLELLGYVLRTCSAVSAFDHDVSRNTSGPGRGRSRKEGRATSVDLYIAQLTLLLLAPLCFTSTLYLCIARLATLYTSSLPFPLLRGRGKPHLFPSLFLALDVLTALLFLPGAAVLASASHATIDPNHNPSRTETANEIFLATLVLQSMVLAGSASLTIQFLFRTKGSRIWNRRRGFRVVLLLALDGVHLRTLFRMAEYAVATTSTTATATTEGSQGRGVLSREVLYGWLEFGPVAVAGIGLTVWFPGRVFRLSCLVKRE
ncbi:hypothetical protein KC329_g13319 [Hortaea werneckii]|nr:hypothetical protein KC329_g13319 [Hortaea werneckii]